LGGGRWPGQLWDGAGGRLKGLGAQKRCAGRGNGVFAGSGNWGPRMRAGPGAGPPRGWAWERGGKTGGNRRWDAGGASRRGGGCNRSRGGKGMRGRVGPLGWVHQKRAWSGGAPPPGELDYLEERPCGSLGPKIGAISIPRFPARHGERRMGGPSRLIRGFCLSWGGGFAPENWNAGRALFGIPLWGGEKDVWGETKKKRGGGGHFQVLIPLGGNTRRAVVYLGQQKPRD